MSGLSITICYLSIYLSIYGGVVEGGGGGPRAGGAPTTPNQLWGGPACKSLRTPAIGELGDCLGRQMGWGRPLVSPLDLLPINHS